MDLRDSSFLQCHVQLGGSSNQSGCSTPTSRDQSVFIHYSTDKGTSWMQLRELGYDSYTRPRLLHVALPPSAKTKTTRVKFWQPTSDDRPAWALDNCFIGGSEISPASLEWMPDREGDDEVTVPWIFHPGGRRLGGYCSERGDAIVWGNDSPSKSITLKPVIVDENYMMQFKIAVGCAERFLCCGANNSVALEYNVDPGTDNWHLLTPACHPGNSGNSGGGGSDRCTPGEFATASVYGTDVYTRWTRVTLPLPEHAFSGSTQFRFIQPPAGNEDTPSWAIRDIYVGEACPDMCSGHGVCSAGRCICEDGFEGETWKVAEVTAEVSFALRLGSRFNDSTCNVEQTPDRAVVVRYSTDGGTTWRTISVHDPAEYLTPRRVELNLPEGAKKYHSQLSWWQPNHSGRHRDQWALDNVEIRPSRRTDDQRRQQQMTAVSQPPYTDNCPPPGCKGRRGNARRRHKREVMRRRGGG
ncbi:PREDICTED: reelin-like [Priapulus caudatus]|uniref:Reelin n=1 Tax=Priapulus caudatus TaxID=37621 RepID=A0ABM1E4J5_PRICU|nr:PREDICTED: reelin-like [Priapulus caudatus]